MWRCYTGSGGRLGCRAGGMDGTPRCCCHQMTKSSPLHTPAFLIHSQKRSKVATHAECQCAISTLAHTLHSLLLLLPSPSMVTYRHPNNKLYCCLQQTRPKYFLVDLLNIKRREEVGGMRDMDKGGAQKKQPNQCICFYIKS